jgi:hypothetical protein
MGRAEANITGWVEYFCAGMTTSFQAVEARVQEEAPLPAMGRKGISANS